jgi:hypothetical protein
VSNPDSFIDEVSEELRRDRALRILRRFGWIGVLAVVLIVGGASWREYDRARDAAAAEAFGDALYSAAEAADGSAFIGLGTTPAQQALAALLATTDAAATADPARRDAILAALAAAASDPTLDPVWSDLAALRRALIAGVDEPLAVPGRPYRTLAEEHLALIALERGDQAGALARLRTLSDDAETPEGQRRRLARLIEALAPAGGEGG